MLIDVASAPKRRPAWLTRGRLLALGGGLLYLAIALVAMMKLQDAFGHVHPLPIIALAVAPLAVVVMFRAPLVFPFGVYAALLPYDALLQLSSGATILKLVAVLTAAALALRILLRHELRAPGKAWYWSFAFIVYIATSFLWTQGGELAIQLGAQYLQLFGLFTILSIYPTKPRELEVALAIIVASGAGAGLFAYHLSKTGSFTVQDERLILAFNGVALDPNYFATSFVMPTAIAFSAAFNLRSVFIRIAAVAASLVMMVGILLSGSRGGFIAIAIVFAYFVVRSRHRFGAALVAAGALAMTAFFPTVWDRFLHDPAAANSGSGRTFIWKTGLLTFPQHWLFGGGVGSFTTIYDRSLLAAHQASFQGWDRPSHSVIVGTLTEYGVIGLVLVLGIWWSSFRQTRHIKPSSRFYWMRLASEAMILGLFSQALFLDILLIKFYWLGYALPLMIAGLARANADRESPVEVAFPNDARRRVARSSW